MNDDQKLTDLFRTYDPELPSSDNFLSSLDRRIDMFDAVRQAESRLRRIYRRAVVAASAAGFAAGALTTLCAPHLKSALRSILSLVGTPTPADSTLTLSIWLIVSAATIAATFSAYNVSLLLMKNKR